MRKISYLLLTAMLVIGMMHIVLPLNIPVTQAAPPPPDDGVDGLQFIQGDWTVTGTESYTDEIIILTGNLTIQNGGSLTLRHVTLAMNCTNENGTYTIEVLSGGTLNITDGDNDPATTNDRSNITDSPYDTDDRSPIDFRTAIKVNSGATLSIENSIIRECGYDWVDNNTGLYINTNNVNIQNCTIENCWYGIYSSGDDYHTIGYNEIKNCDEYGIYYSGCDYVDVFNNNIHHCDNGMYGGGQYNVIKNNYIHNNSNIYPDFQEWQESGLELRIDYSEVYNNTIKYNGASVPFCYNVEMFDCDYTNFHHNKITNVKPGSFSSVYISYYCTYLNFHNNTISNNDDDGLRFHMTGLQTYNNKFIDNVITDNNGYGAFFDSWGDSSETATFLFKNNYIYNCSTGLRLQELRTYNISNNEIRSCRNYGVYVNDVHGGEFSNNTVNATDYDFGLQDSYFEMDTVFEVVNCTCDPSKTQINNGRPKLQIKNFLHVNVYDKNSIVPGALVTIRNNTGVPIFSGKTNMNGTIRYIKILNQTTNHRGTKYFDPHNITATYNIFNSYGEIEPTMNKSQTVNVYFNFDLPPHPVRELIAKSNGVNVDLSWQPSRSLDVDYYLVYRNGTGSSWDEVYNSSSNPPQKLWTNWTDLNGASNPATYRYKVVAVDLLWQKSPDSEIAACGDWIIDDIRMVTGLSGLLNGSIVILPSSNLTLKNSKIQFNNSFKGQFGTEVQPGGKLYILDNDNNPQTTTDQSIISGLDTKNTSYLSGDNAEVVIRNSQISNFGFDGRTIKNDWTVESAPDILSNGENKNRGLYLFNSVVTIKNNVFLNNYVSILLDNSDSRNIKGNSFQNNAYGIYLNNVNNISITGNTFDNNSGFSIYLLDSENISIYSNEIKNPDLITSGIGMYRQDCKDNKIFLNNFTEGDNGIKIIDAGRNNNISNNDFKNQGNSIYLQRTSWNILIENTFYNTDESTIYLNDAHFSTIIGGYSDESYYGYFLEDSNNAVISGINIDDSTYSGIYLHNSGRIEINQVSIDTSSYGIYIYGGTTINMTYISINNCTRGIYGSDRSDKLEINNSQIFNGVQTAVDLNNCFITVFENCTFNASNYNFDLSSSNALLFNTTYNQNRVTLDLSSSIYINWYINVQVIDWYGNPAANTNIQVREALGTLKYNGDTDSNGWVGGIWLLERIQFTQYNRYSTPYSIRANLGNHSGVEVLSLNQSTILKVHLENVEPEAKNIEITPLYPTTVSELKLNYQYSDSENDPEDKTKIQWYINGIHDSNHDNLTTINSGSTSKGQTWQCEIFPHDGALYGVPMLSTSVTIQNTKPEVSDVIIVESSPRSDQDLHINYSYSDIDNDPEVGSQRKWYRNDGTGWKKSKIDAMTLSAEDTKKGELWKCIVRPFDGDDFGDKIESPPVTIGNTAPSVSNAKITPANPRGNDTIKVNYAYFDLDSDPESGSQIRWFKDDQEDINFTGSTTISSSKTKRGEKWHYIIVPSDGEDFGDPLESDPVVIGNTVPRVANITIIPKDPTTSDNLTVVYDFIDDDFDSESFETNVQWLRKRQGDIDFAYTGLKVKTLSSVHTTKNEVWTCEVTPHDNYAYGKITRAEVSVTILNSKPIVTNLFITPESPTTKDELIANYKYLDLDGDIESGSEVRWYKDNSEVVELKNKLIVHKSHTAKGQSWYFSIRPRDGQELGNAYISNNITIQNTPPSAMNLTIKPSYPLGDDDLSASYIYFDEDGDIELTPEIKWYRVMNKGLFHESLYDNKFSVDSKATEKGDLWYFSLRVFDGVDYSSLLTSHYVSIENSRAIINRIQPAPGKITINETESIEFYINATDPDGDILLYKWKIESSLESELENYLFKTDYESEGIYNLTLVIQDLTQNFHPISFEWKITVLKKNRPPRIIVIEPLGERFLIEVPKSLKFSISATDPDVEDKNKLVINWSFGNTPELVTGSTYAYVAKSEHIGDRVVRVVVSDGIDDVEYSWNVTVEKEETEGQELFMGQSYDWWGLIMAIISGIIAVMMFLFGILRMRRKKSKLRQYMDEIEEITESDKDPHEKENELKDLKKQIKYEFTKEMINENHYIILEREVDNAIGDIRTTIVEERVAMPDELKGEVEEVLEDGVVTKEEYGELMNRIRTTRDLNAIERNRLQGLLTRWMMESKRDQIEIPKKPKDNKNIESTIKKRLDEKEQDID